MELESILPDINMTIPRKARTDGHLDAVHEEPSEEASEHSRIDPDSSSNSSSSNELFLREEGGSFRSYDSNEVDFSEDYESDSDLSDSIVNFKTGDVPTKEDEKPRKRIPIDEFIKDDVIGGIFGNQDGMTYGGKGLDPAAAGAEPMDVEDDKDHARIAKIHKRKQRERLEFEQQQLVKLQEEAYKKNMRSKIERFVLKHEDDINPDQRQTNINVFLKPFEVIVQDNIDILNVLEGLQIYWEDPWGEIINVSIFATFEVYHFIVECLQGATNFLGLNQRLHSDSYWGEAMLSPLVPPPSPFIIILVNIPRNFLRKIVGGSATQNDNKNLNQLRKEFEVDFDYERSKLSEEIFPMSETADLRVFGRWRDVDEAYSRIKKEIELLQMRTMTQVNHDLLPFWDPNVLKQLKGDLDPCEVRVKRNTTKMFNFKNPFFSQSPEIREIALVGTITQIEQA